MRPLLNYVSRLEDVLGEWRYKHAFLTSAIDRGE
jgi:hypothetical protein